MPFFPTSQTPFQACGLLPTGPEPLASSPTPTPAQGSSDPDFPAFLQACLGVDGWRRTSDPFIGASTISRIVDVALAVSSLDGSLDLTANAEKGDDVTAPENVSEEGKTAPGRFLSLLVLEGLLGVLAAEESTAVPPPSVASDSKAVVIVREKGLSLVLAAFSGCGTGRRADRVWQDFGVSALANLILVSVKSSSGGALVDREALRSSSVWQEFLDSAVEHTRWVMEGGDNKDGDGGDCSGGPEVAKQVATLALALIELEAKIVLRIRSSYRAQEGDHPLIDRSTAISGLVGSGSLGKGYLPILWRLGLTQPSVWRQRRAEMFAGLGAREAVAGSHKTPEEMANFARACVQSRWARRCECTSSIFARYANARTRLSLLMEGVVGVGGGDGGAIKNNRQDVDIAGEALQEILAASVTLGRAARLLEGEGYGGLLLPTGLVDLPRGLEVPSAKTKKATTGGDKVGSIAAFGEVGKKGGVSGSGELLAEFGVGLPNFRGVSAGVKEGISAVAGIAAVRVLDAAASHLGSDGSAFKAATGASSRVASIGNGHPRHHDDEPELLQQQLQDPFSLWLPRDLWPAAFKAQATAEMDLSAHLSPPGATGSGDKTGSSFGSTWQESQGLGSISPAVCGTPAPSPLTGGPPSFEDACMHGVLISALSSAVKLSAKDIAMLDSLVDGTGEVEAWRVSCSAEVWTALLVAAVGEPFTLGLRLGEEAKRWVCACV